MAQEIALKKQDPELVSPLNLAFIGDSVYELIIRNTILSERNGSLKYLNEECTKLSMASTQCKIVNHLMPELTDEEIRIYKRGRNSKSVSAPKSCTIGEYRQATGLESLIGYLYLADETERLCQLIERGIELYRENDLED